MKKSVFTLMIAGAVFIGYLSGCKRNEMPVIESLVSENSKDTLVVAGDTVKVICTATDADENELFYTWDASGGGFTESEDGTEITWVAPNQSGIYNIVCKVTDLEEDTVNLVADTLTIDVQNYFPVALGSYWKYEGQAIGIPAVLENTMYSKEDMAGGKVRWHIQREFKWGVVETIDSVLYYITYKDSVWVFDPAEEAEYLAYHLPFWEGKTWNTGEGGTGSVVEIREYGTPAGGFDNSVRVDLDLASSTNDRTLWLAPDVGVIVTKYYIGESIVDFVLVEYGLE